MELIHKRTVGSTTLVVYPQQRSTLAMGRAHAARGFDTVYAVVACATKGRNTLSLGTFPDSESAIEYVNLYKTKLGLISKG